MHGKCPVQVYHCFLYIVFFTVPFLCLDTQVLATAATVLQMPTVFSTVGVQACTLGHQAVPCSLGVWQALPSRFVRGGC